MIIVTGSVVAKPGVFDEVLSLCRAHVARSRREDGCDHHAVHRDDDNPQKLVFVERWRDRAALAKHFADPAARGFVKAVQELAAAVPTIDIYEAQALTVKDIMG
jgi:quinol monooxygenase YgiN